MLVCLCIIFHVLIKLCDPNSQFNFIIAGTNPMSLSNSRASLDDSGDNGSESVSRFQIIDGRKLSTLEPIRTYWDGPHLLKAGRPSVNRVY